MGKDKGEKPAKDKKNSAFGKPSEAKGGGDGWRAEHEDNIGELFLITPLREEDFTGDWGEQKVIVADVVVINEKKPEKSELHEEVFFFGGYTKGSLRGYIGEQKVLGRLGKGAATKGKNAPWIIEDATPAEEGAALAYLETVDPFKQSSSDKKKSKK